MDRAVEEKTPTLNQIPQNALLWKELLGVFLLSFGVLLFQVTATKISEYSLWSNYAFLIISTSMFGLGLSGVMLTRWPGMNRIDSGLFLAVCALFCGLTTWTAFLGLNHISIHLPAAPQGWVKEMLHLGALFFVLGLPFVFFGLIISRLFTDKGEKAGYYYCADLVGAGLGSLGLMFFISLVEPQGLVLMATMLALVSAGLFFTSSAYCGRMGAWGSGLFSILIIVAGVAIMPSVPDRFPLNVHVEKRTYKKDLEAKKITSTAWSALSRVDVAPLNQYSKRVWISGGVNESSIIKFDGDFEALRNKRQRNLERAAQVINYEAFPHLFKKDHTVCMIGTSGGADSLYALSMGARYVVGVEMDPGVASMVMDKYRDYAGGLFQDGKYSELVIDEGRSYLRRTDRKFDIIQQVNNFTPIAFMNGALNLSETYLLTVESFQDFYDHLEDDGILSISRYGSFKLLSNAVEMFRRMGMKPEEYSKHFLIAEGPQPVIPTFMLKKSPFTPEEIRQFEKFYYKYGKRRRILYAPHIDLPDNIYAKIATAENPAAYYRQNAYDFSPALDSKPFFNHFSRLGIDDRRRHENPYIPSELRVIEPKNVFRGRIPPGDIPVLAVLLAAFVMSTVFLGLPMLSKGELRKSLRRERKALVYFACLGIAFIFVEVCLIQRFVLFLGKPVYSISIVLCSMLLAAGLGSLLSDRLHPSRKNLIRMLIVVGIVILAMHAVIPWLTQAFIGSSLYIRFIIAIVFITGSCLVMGMPMPLGIRYLKKEQRPIIAWAWAINGYFSVIGSALAVMVALTFGFGMVFSLAAICYLLAPFFLVAPTDRGVVR